MRNPVPEPVFPPVARLRSFHPFLLALSWILIVVAVAAAMAVGIFWAHARRSALLMVVLPAGFYAAARIFLPIELTADHDEIRWKEPFHAAQVVRRRDIAGIRQRVKRNSSYAYFVDRDGRERLFVGPIFTPAQMRDFAAALGLSIEDVTAEPPHAPQLEALQRRSNAEGNRSYSIVFTGFLTLVAWSLWGLVTYAVITATQSLDAYGRAAQCTTPPTQPQTCRYLTTVVASDVAIDSRGERVSLSLPAGIIGSGPRQTWVRVSPDGPKPAIEKGGTVQVEIWGDSITTVNAARTDEYNTMRSNANWLLPIVFAPFALGTAGFFIWMIRSRVDA